MRRHDGGQGARGAKGAGDCPEVCFLGNLLFTMSKSAALRLFLNPQRSLESQDGLLIHQSFSRPLLTRSLSWARNSIFFSRRPFPYADSVSSDLSPVAFASSGQTFYTGAVNERRHEQAAPEPARRCPCEYFFRASKGWSTMG
jgi:hypothetical protein